MTLAIGYVLVAVGGGLVAAGSVADTYLSRRFDAHTDRLRRLSENGETEEVSEEVQAFAKDRRIDLATRLLLAEPVGVVVLVMGVVFLVV